MSLNFKKVALIVIVVCVVISSMVIFEHEEHVNEIRSDESTIMAIEAFSVEEEDDFRDIVHTEKKKENYYENHYEYKSGSLGTFTLTAYCSCVKCCGQYAINRPVDENGNEIVYGSTGTRLTAGVSIAVDPRVIPYGSKVVINGRTYVAHDTGGGIRGNRIDVYFDNHQDALNFGVQKAEVFLVAD